eukprot:COSAG02_NODE_49021_length_329_cov_24.665217_1_plen_47_part_01
MPDGRHWKFCRLSVLYHLAMATAGISESMAEKLRPKVVAMIEAGRER